MHEVYRGWRSVSDAYGGDRTFVAEAWVDSPERLARYTRADELHTAFNFDFVRARLGRRRAARDDRRVPGTRPPWSARRRPGCCPTTTSPGTRPATRGSTPPAAASTDEARVGPDTPLDPALGLRRARAATLLMLALPGSAYVYQGEELGLPEVVDLPEDVLADPIWERSGHTVRGRDGCRVPIPWTVDGPSLGFGSGAPWLPQPRVVRRAVGAGRAGCRGLDPRALPRRAGARAVALDGRPDGRLAALARGVAVVPPRRRPTGPRWSASSRAPPRRCRCRRTTRCWWPAPTLERRRRTATPVLPGDAAVWLRVR